MTKTSGSIRGRWRSTAILIVVAALLAVCIAPALTSAVTPQVSAGEYHTLAVKSDGTLWAWGSNQHGRLGLGHITTPQTSPVQVGSAATWTDVSAGSAHTLAVKSDGSLWAWGWNNNGQLGLGDQTDRNSSVWVCIGTTWTDVSAGGLHTVAIKSDGTLWAWGYNVNGQLGLGNTTQQTSPVQVGSGTTWTDVSAGYHHTLAVKSDGTLWAWGYNGNGQLGLGNTTQQTSPVQVGSGTTWTDVSAGREHTLAVQSNGTLWAWGDNEYGQLGLGDETDRNSSVRVGSGTTWTGVSAGDYHTLAVQSDGTLWAWGHNTEGQLGLGDTTPRNSSVQVGSCTTYTDPSAGGYHTLSIKSDGTLWAWGYNDYGQLGLGDVVTPRTSPEFVFDVQTCGCGDICVNTTGWWRDCEAFNAIGTPVQAAVDNATVGDVICVRDGTYTENVDVDVAHLTIRSENGSASCTVAAASSSDHVFDVQQDYVNISGFTVTGATGFTKAGIYLGSGIDHCNISGNNASGNNNGISLSSSSNNTLTSNTANSNTYYGIYLYSSSNNTLTENTANSNTQCGIRLYDSSDNNVSCNWVQNNTNAGFCLISTNTGNTIEHNNIIANGVLQGDGSYQYQFVNSQGNAVEAKHNYWGAGMNNSTIKASIMENTGAVTFYPFRTGPAPCAPVPEAATVLLFAVGLLMLAGYVRIGRRK